MKKNKSFLGLVFFLLLSILIVGCSQDVEKETTDKKEDGDEATTEERASFTSAIYDRGEVPAAEGTIEDNRWTNWLVENGPADIDFVPIPRWESVAKYNVLFASGDAPDLVYEYTSSYRSQLISEKLLMPVTDLIENHSTEYKAFLEKYPALKKVSVKEDGEIYEFGRVNALEPNNTLWVRQDWLDKLGLEVPQTVEELYTVIEAFTKNDPDGNGEDDTLGMGISFVGNNVINAMFQNENWYVNGDGKLVKTWDQLQAMIEFKKSLYDENLIDRDFLADANGENSKQDFINGKLGLFGVNGGAGAGGFALYEALKTNVPEAKVVAIPLPESEFGKFSPPMSNPVQLTTAISATAENPEAIMEYVDFLVKDTTQKTLAYGIEGEHYQQEGDTAPKVIDPEKNKQELNWNGDLKMLVSSGNFGEWGRFKATLDPEVQLEKEYIDIINQSEEAYVTPERPIASITHSEHMPALPKDLELINTNTSKQMTSYIEKAIVGGSDYTAEQAIADAKKYWEQAGGKQIEEFMAQWYEENKDTAFLTKDMYDFK